MLIIDIEIDTVIQNFNVNPGATKCLWKVAWDLYLVPDRRVSFRLTDSIELLRTSTYVSSKTREFRFFTADMESSDTLLVTMNVFSNR
jgi:hypothetical protein